MAVLLGVDTGGTFTDFVCIDNRVSTAESHLRVHKVLSTPAAPEQAILQGIRELGLLDCRELVIVHGSTVATNAVLEGKGVRTAFITNHGMGDLLTIGRQARAQLYALNPQPRPVPVPADLCLETGGRLGADGRVLEELTEDMLHSLHEQLRKLKPQAVAISLLFSYLDGRYERRIADIVPAGVFVSCSSQVLPEVREYERGIATWLNAAVGPLMQGYLQRLCGAVPQASVAVMQSAGGTMDASQAGAEAVHLLLSGPAGGLCGAAYVGRVAGRERLLSFDMGGTSTDVALLDGEIQLTTEGRIGPYPVGVPMVDMHTIGAGGGSIARVDAGGLLQVGPESAGAAPGPACYGQGGQEPTVTDANLVLGRLRSDNFLGGGMRLDESAARDAIQSIAAPLGLSLEAAALGVIDLANEHMARALRVMSVQRGLDPAGLTLTCFGGAGGLHVCALAEALGMHQALVPVHAGVLSALGMLAAPRTRHLSLTINSGIDAISDARVDTHIAELARRGEDALLREGLARDELERFPSVDLRYHGQSYAVNVPWQGRAPSSAEFHQRHEALYGHRLDQEVELVTLRVKVQRRGREITLTEKGTGLRPSDHDTVSLVGIEAPVPVYARDGLHPGQQISGPALIAETVSTTYLAPRWRGVVHASGSLLLEHGQ